MTGFEAPAYSSSPPTTPNKHPSNPFNFAQSNPSTTPAGPPPSSAGSFTPAGPPPSSIFGSSMLGGTNVNPLSFSQQNDFQSSRLTFEHPKSSVASFLPPGRSGLSNEYRPAQQRGFEAPQPDSEDDEEDGEEYIEEEQDQYGESRRFEDEADAMSDDEEQYDDDEEMDDQPRPDEQTESDFDLPVPPLLRASVISRFQVSAYSDQPKEPTFDKIAKDIYSRMHLPKIAESDDLVLETDEIAVQLYVGEDEFGNIDKLQVALRVVPRELTMLWAAYHQNTAVVHSEEYTATIGHGSRSTDFAKANFLAGFALKLRHPVIDDSVEKRSRIKSLPEVAFDWEEEYHNAFPYQLESVTTHRPSPANHELFWPTLMNCLLRGKVALVVNMLKMAGWKHARAEDEYGQPTKEGYSGVALANVERVVGIAVETLTRCPGFQGDWRIRSSEWAVFRLQASQALQELQNYAEGSGNINNESITSNASQYGSYSQTARRAKSRVPWNVYQRLMAMYKFVIGDAAVIIQSARDWCEATIGLMGWWDDGKLERRVGRPSQIPDFSDTEVHLRKLRKCLSAATSEDLERGFKVNTADAVEVALASLFEGNLEAVIGFLRAWSGPVSSAVAEVASLAGWLPQAESQNLISMGSLDEEAMDVLGLDSSPSKADGVKDQTLIAYARALWTVKKFEGQEITRNGWELAISILGRLDSASRSEEMIEDFLKGFSLDSSATVDKLWVLLNDIGMTGLAEATAESHANTLAEGTHKYGEALWYYALAHRTQKVKDVLDLLISLSLVQSTAYPPESELDDHLRRLLSSPKNALTEMSRMDAEAAELIHKLLSGYATLRNFYDLRDEELDLKKQLSPGRKQEAVSALLAVITSSDDNIRGGLYDEERGAIVSVDFLLALLGEAMVFVNQPGSSLTAPQIDILLKAIEDFQTVSSRIQTLCNEFLQTVIASGQGLKGSAPTDMLRKSTSNTSGTSSFSMVGSSMYASQLKQSMSSSGVLVKGNIKRGWDWRRGISANMKGEDLLRVMRLGLAKDLANAWLVEVDNKL